MFVLSAIIKQGQRRGQIVEIEKIDAVRGPNLRSNEDFAYR
jgi:hypothetical protein